MSNDDQGNAILDQWHAAKVTHATAPDGEKDAAMAAVYAAERAAIGHFGLGKHMKAYIARFPDDPI
ncbi:hypothetical protein WL88_22195 [Burkholderia diffusa]|uniref:Uncharacterized protein n=1 Tax=Burkholderia diffusa TaxID=488732 RepID=A0AAW3PCC9_9BURK|nr:hypothetical protein [Burkholderia diffusa]KWF35823.1 hypothetical protein WL86_21310 [Burkholderia diffusa]KWF39188.1 hypothetical protein WL85_09290 [Burkholderia diffusa]KWF40964.1 hypothetical protein WL87_28575 [Burkholderia diffusa]KWF49334.1 hypothetical protein WL88_22195 [Burkholderia diffusa]